MRNLKLLVEYDGAGFSGYELQPGKRTVRSELEKALRKIFRQAIKLISSSRTDSKVHALGLVCNFKTQSRIPAKNIAEALNSVLPEDIRIVSATEVSQGFNSRYAAKSKTYEYLIFNGKVMPPQLRKLAWQVKPRLELKPMKKAAKYLIGRHDFTSFRAAGGDDADLVRTIYSFVIRNSSLVIWGNIKSKIIRLQVKGNGFLYKMVRNLVGTLVEIGLKKRTPADMKKILKKKDRRAAGKCAPAQGLCLVRVDY